MRVAVSGATGLLGRHLCSHFHNLGWHVRALVRRPDATPRLPGIEVFSCDLPDVIDPRGLESTDALVHCAYTTRFLSIEAAKRTNEEGTRRLLAASRAAGVRRFVFMSSLAAHPQSRSYYGRSKHALEQLMDPARDLIIRPGLILAYDGGLYSRIRRSVARLPVVPVFAGGHQRIQTIHIDDLCTAVAHALATSVSGLLRLAEPEGVPLVDLMRMVASQLDKSMFAVPLPVRPVLWVLRLAERVGLSLPISSENVLGLLSLIPQNTRPDLERLGMTVRPARESIAHLS